MLPGDPFGSFAAEGASLTQMRQLPTCRGGNQLEQQRAQELRLRSQHVTSDELTRLLVGVQSLLC